jgi:hypothetical protein
MDQTLYNRAEAAYHDFKKANDVDAELLLAWLLAEIHFAQADDVQIKITLGGLPDTMAKKILWHTLAMGYLEFRHEMKRNAAKKT